MKRISSLSILAGALLVAAAGCLKDKSFDSGNYGIQVGEIKAVAFPGANKPVNQKLQISTSQQSIADVLNITIESGIPAESDVDVNVANTTGSTIAGDIKAYNDANGTNIQIMPSALITFPETITIAAGQNFAKRNIIISNTTGLNPSLQYGFALTITGASSGYQVAGNTKKILVIFRVTNTYEGKYLLKTRFGGGPVTTFPLLVLGPGDIELIPRGPNSVIMYSNLPGFVGFCHPHYAGSTIVCSAGFEIVYTINPSTNAVTVFNDYPGSPTILAMGANGFTGTVYEAPGGFNSRWDGANKTIYANFGYNMSGSGHFIPGVSRMWIDTLIWTGPR
jgi:Domain of unknown function (DUF1735)